MNFLLNHDSPETAFLVSDYPYGYNKRCRIRYWIEKNKKGARFCSQTEHPVRKIWNAPKMSTYWQEAVMFLNEKGHVTWSGVSPHSSAAQLNVWIENHSPALTGEEIQILKVLKAVKEKMEEKFASGQIRYEISGSKPLQIVG